MPRNPMTRWHQGLSDSSLQRWDIPDKEVTVLALVNPASKFDRDSKAATHHPPPTHLQLEYVAAHVFTRSPRARVASKGLDHALQVCFVDSCFARKGEGREAGLYVRAEMKSPTSEEGRARASGCAWPVWQPVVIASTTKPVWGCDTVRT